MGDVRKAWAIWEHGRTLDDFERAASQRQFRAGYEVFDINRPDMVPVRPGSAGVAARAYVAGWRAAREDWNKRQGELEPA